MLLPAWRAERLPSATEREKKEGNERTGVGVHAGVGLSGGVAPRMAEEPRGHPTEYWWGGPWSWRTTLAWYTKTMN